MVDILVIQNQLKQRKRPQGKQTIATVMCPRIRRERKTLSAVDTLQSRLGSAVHDQMQQWMMRMRLLLSFLSDQTACTQAFFRYRWIHIPPTHPNNPPEEHGWIGLKCEKMSRRARPFRTFFQIFRPIRQYSGDLRNQKSFEGGRGKGGLTWILRYQNFVWGGWRVLKNGQKSRYANFPTIIDHFSYTFSRFFNTVYKSSANTGVRKPCEFAIDHVIAEYRCLVREVAGSIPARPLLLCSIFSKNEKSIIYFWACRARVLSSAVEHGIADPAVAGSIPAVPFFCL